MTTALGYWPVIVELTIPSTNLVYYLCTAFEILEFVDDLITKSDLPVRKATECILIHCFQSFACTTHEAITRKITNFTAINIHVNNKTKICTDSLAANAIEEKKKVKEFLLRFIVFTFILGLCYVLWFFQNQTFWQDNWSMHMGLVFLKVRMARTTK